MTYSKALNILMLSFNFTEQDLKKSYRSLSKKYHPDNFITDEEKRIAHEKMCEINEAHAVLKQIKANPNSYQEDRKVNINEYREELIRKIYKFLLPSENDEYYLYLALYNFKISNIITLFEKRLTENIYISVEPKLMDNEYMKATNAIKKQFRKLQQRFYTDNKIDATKVTEPLEYNCSLKEFYKQLLMIDKKYGLKAQISQRLTKEIEEYKAVPDYNAFITALSFIKNSYYEKIVSNATLLKAYKQDENNLEIARLILQMHKQIREYIKQYHYLKNQVTSLESTINAIGDIEIEFKYLELKNNLVFATNLDEIFKKLNTLKNSIRHYELQSTYQRVRAI